MSQVTDGAPVDWSAAAEAGSWRRIVAIAQLQGAASLDLARRGTAVWPAAVAAFTAGGAVTGALAALVAALADGK